MALDGDEDGFLLLLAGLEAQSEHHIAAAIRRAVAVRGLSSLPVTDTANRSGKGIVGTDALGTVWAGNPCLAAEMDADLCHPALAALDRGSQTLIYLGRGSQLLGAITAADEARASAAPAFAALRTGGVRRIVIMTGTGGRSPCGSAGNSAFTPRRSVPRCCPKTRCGLWLRWQSGAGAGWPSSETG